MDSPVPLKSNEGIQSLSDAKGLLGFARVCRFYETQITQSYCGVASSVIALNAAGVEAPEVAAWKPYRGFTQAAFFDPTASVVVSEEQVRTSGLTLNELAGVLKAHGARVDTYHADSADPADFRKRCLEALESDSAVALINYDRKQINQKGAGHISPLGAYDPATDRFLVMDVARYRLPPVWVSTSALWRAMQSVDSSCDLPRGYVLVYVADKR